MKIQSKVVLSIFAFLLMFSFVSAVESEGWYQFGNTPPNMPHSQFEDIYGRLNSNYYNISITQGATNYPNQPIVHNFGNPTNNYLVFYNGNYLQVYDKNLILVTEKLTTQPIGSFGIVSKFNTVSSPTLVTGVFDKGSGSYSIEFYDFNYSTSSISLYRQRNFSASNFTFTGLRCKSGGNSGACYGVGTEYNGSRFGSAFFNIPMNESIPVVMTLLVPNYNLTSAVTDVVSWDDYDNDGSDEFLVLSPSRVDVVNSAGVVEREFNVTSGEVFVTARFFYPSSSTSSSTPLENLAKGILSFFGYNPIPTGLGKILVAKEYSVGATKNLRVIVYNSDGSTYWSSEFSLSTGVASVIPHVLGVSSVISTLDTSDTIGLPDVYIAVQYASPVTNWFNRFYILKGTDGTVVQNLTTSSSGGATQIGNLSYPSSSLTIARLNPDNEFDMLISGVDGWLIYDPVNNNISQLNKMSIGNQSCVPADMDFDSILDVVCTGVGRTNIYFSNYTNENAQISSITYDPSTSLVLGQNLNMYVTATDLEANTIYYSRRCTASDSFSADTTSSSLSCLYNSTGFFNQTIRVRDAYHSDYDTYSQIISVTTTGATCVIDGICGAGETFASCPSDCSATNETGSFTSEGGVSIPTDLVNTEDTTQGLLPEIYFGTLAFFSNVTLPFLIIIVFVIAGMIILALGRILHKFANG